MVDSQHSISNCIQIFEAVVCNNGKKRLFNMDNLFNMDKLKTFKLATKSPNKEKVKELFELYGPF